MKDDNNTASKVYALMTREELWGSLEFVEEERERLQKENDLLREELKDLKRSIDALYNEMNSLDIIYKHEMEEDIEVI